MKLATVALSVLIALSLAGCGKRSSNPASPPTPPTTSSPAPAAVEPPAGAVAPPPVVAEPSAAEQAADAKARKPAKQVSEMDDDVETVDEASGASARGPSVNTGSTTEVAVAHFKEGVNYKPIVPAQPTDAGPGRVEVAEVFWYGCPHCFALDPQLESWRHGGAGGKKPAWADFVRIPAVWNDELRMHARLFYTLEALGRLDELHPVVFREIQVNGNPLNSPDKIAAFLRAHGVDAADFQKTFTSFSVESRLQRADLLGRRYRVQSVPLIIVNGKYASDLGMAGSPDQLLALTNELALQEHAR
jgi:thiol:disulfide interchange protein DsbA